MESTKEWLMELLRNQALENQIKYTPVRVFDSEDDEGKSRVFSGVCTLAVNGEWDTGYQVFFLALIIILALTIRQKNVPECASTWPVYLKLGNIAKRRVHQVEIGDR